MKDGTYGRDNLETRIVFQKWSYVAVPVIMLSIFCKKGKMALGTPILSRELAVLSVNNHVCLIQERIQEEF